MSEQPPITPIGETEHLSCFDGRATVSGQYLTPALMDDLVELLSRHGFPIDPHTWAECAERRAKRESER